MKRKEKKAGSGLLYGISFAAPVVYSVILQEMDNLQRLIFIVITLLIYITVIYRFKNDSQVAFHKLLSVLIVLFPVSFLTAFANSSEFNLPILYSNLLIPLCIIMLAVFMLFILGEERFFKTISVAVVTFSTLFALIGLLEVFKIVVIPLPTVIPPGSTAGHRSFAIEYLLPSLPFILILKENVKRDFYPVLLIGAFINVSFILFTRSRSAMVVLGILTLAYFIHTFIKSHKEIKKLLPAAAVIAAAFVFSLLPAEGGQRTDLTDAAASMFDPAFRSNRLRLTYWSASLQMISENPLTGSGLYKWSGFYPKYFGGEFNDKTVKFVQSIHAHNDFLELFAENGFLAPLFYLLLLIVVLRVLYSKSKNNQAYYYIFLSVLATALFSFVAFPFYKFSSHFLFSAGAGVAILTFKDKSGHEISFSYIRLRFLFLILILAGVLISVIRLKSEIDYIKGIQLLRMGLYGQMVEQLNKVSAQFYPYDPSKQPVDYYRGVGYSFIKKFPEALRYNLSAEELAPYNPVIMNNVATAYHSIGNTEEAISRFERMKELFPDYSDPQTKLLYLYVAGKQEEKGKKLLDELLEKFPDNPGLEEIKKQLLTEK